MYIQSNCSVTTIHFFIDLTYIEAAYLQIIYKFSFRSSIIGSQRRPNAAGNHESKRSVLAHSELANKLVRYDLGPYIHTYIHTYLHTSNNSVLFRHKAVRRTGRMQALNVSCSGPPIGVIQELNPGGETNGAFYFPI